LEKSLAEIDLENHPEKILKDLINKTKSTIDKCFPPRCLSNRAQKRAEKPWIDKEISKEETLQTKLFRKYRASNSQTDHKNYKNFRKKNSVRRKRKERKPTSENS